MLASVFLAGSYNQLSNVAGSAQLAAGLLEKVPVTVPVEPEELVMVNGAVMAVAGAGLALGIKPRFCAATLAAVLVPTTLAGHRFWAETDPAKVIAHRNAFFANLAVFGALLGVVSEPGSSAA